MLQLTFASALSTSMPLERRSKLTFDLPDLLSDFRGAYIVNAVVSILFAASAPVAIIGLRVASEMALHVLAYNLTRLMNILGIQPLIAAIRA
jgi:hypothetical protein